jgi:hypothetical protein
LGHGSESYKGKRSRDEQGLFTHPSKKSNSAKEDHLPMLKKLKRAFTDNQGSANTVNTQFSNIPSDIIQMKIIQIFLLKEKEFGPDE